MRQFFLTVAFGVAAIAAGESLSGFHVEPPFGEQVRILDLPSSVTITINAPPADKLDSTKRTRLVFYALPNGNTTSQTIGRQKAEGLDWHYFIQHIGAQTRRVRELVPDENIIVAYAENGLRSWPAWRSQRDGGSTEILSIVRATTETLALRLDSLELTGHSGGGSFIFGFINGHEELPSYLKRLAFLDATYAYSTGTRHAEKLANWISESTDTFLLAYSYDDRGVKINGKPIVSEWGGTYGRTTLMIRDLQTSLGLKVWHHKDGTHALSDDERVALRILDNPSNAILHTVLVEKNGFTHALLTGTHKTPDVWMMEPRYTHWIAP